MVIVLFTFKQVNVSGELYEGFFCNRCGKTARLNDGKKVIFCIPCMIKEHYDDNDLPDSWKADPTISKSPIDEIKNLLGRFRKNA